MALLLTGECRGLKSKTHGDKTKHYLVVEDENLNLFNLGLGDDQAALIPKLNEYKTRQVTVPIEVGQYNGTVWYRYMGKSLPSVSVAKAS